jgi:hypothetical protein
MTSRRSVFFEKGSTYRQLKESLTTILEYWLKNKHSNERIIVPGDISFYQKDRVRPSSQKLKKNKLSWPLKNFIPTLMIGILIYLTCL